MRRKDREVTDMKEIISIMKRCDVCRLAWNADPVPYVIPLNFGLEVQGEKITLWFHGALESAKYQFFDQPAAFEMDVNDGYFYKEDKKSCTMLFESVIGQGKIRMVEGEEKRKGLRLIMEHAHMQEMPWDPGVEKMTRVYCLEVENLSAKRRPKPKGY